MNYCKKCKFFDPSKEMPGAREFETGICRFNPPIAESGLARYPFVHQYDDGCSQFIDATIRLNWKRDPSNFDNDVPF